MSRPTIILFVGVTVSTVTLPLDSVAAEQASRAAQSHAAQSQARSTTGTPLDDGRLAQDWGLKVEELVRYRQLMQGPLGVYSPNLDPLTALGIESRSDEERRRYAELQVRMEGRRVEKLLAYQRAYQEAWKQVHPDLRPINAALANRMDQPSALARMKTQGRTAVFIKDDCASCYQRVRQLQANGKSFDLYMIGSRQDDARIRRWAGRAGIDPEKVRAGTITLNHDSGRWFSIGGRGELPAVMHEADGRWVRD